MTTPKKIPAEQMNLPLCETPPMTLPKDKQSELAASEVAIATDSRGNTVRC